MLGKFNYRKLYPWIPLIGIVLVAIGHFKYHDTGIENPVIHALSAMWQAISIIGLIVLSIVICVPHG